MTFLEKVFLGVLYAMYLYDCVFWLAPQETGLTRTSPETWQATRREALSFTLLGRTPVLASVWLLYPGFIRYTGDASARTQRALRSVARRLTAMRALLTLCRLQAFILLVYLPVLLWLHRLAALWPILLLLLLAVHVALCTLAILALRSSQRLGWRTAAASLALNPLGATRALDVIAQAFFDQALTHQRRESQRADRNEPTSADAPRKSP